MSHDAPSTPLRALGWIVVAALGLTLPGLAGESSAEDGSFELGSVVFHQRTLDNGLVAFAARDDDPTVSIFLTVDAGRRYETPETNGLAHLTEHALYTGTATTGADAHDARIHELDGESNASTRDDYILIYDHRLPVEALDEVLEMEADRLRGLTFDRSAVLHERDRLRDEEIRTYTRAMAREEKLESVAFRSHAYRVGVLEQRLAAGGAEEGLHTRGPELSVEAVKAFYDAHYHPNRVALVVAGSVDPEAALDAVEKAFGGLARGPEAAAPEQETRSRATEPHSFPSALPSDRLEWIWLGPAMASEETARAGGDDRPALAILARWLGRQTLTDGSPVRASMGGRLDADLFRLAATGPRAEKELAGLLERVRDRVLPSDELAELKALARDDVDSLALRGRPYFSLASEVAIHALHDRLHLLRGHAAAIDAVTPETVLVAARRWLAPETKTVVLFEGTGEERPALPEDVGELRQLAADASESGQLDLAIQAYSRLLELKPNRMNTVIYLATRGQLRVEQKEYADAIRDYEEALAVVDYPAVRDLLDEARRLEAGGLRTAPSAPDPASAAPATASAAPATASAEPATASSTESSSKSEPAESVEKPAEPLTLEAQIEGLQREIEDWRGLKFEEAVRFEKVSPEEAEDPDLAGWYEPETDRLVVVDRNSAAFRRGTLLHELYHALQDQHFDLDALREKSDQSRDAQHALSALIEGEAMLAVSEILSYDFEAHSEIPEEGEIEEDRYHKIFHYGDGLRFVRKARNEGGWDAVAALYANPPRSTAEILHPELYPRPDADFEARDFVFAPPVGESPSQGRLGEHQLRYLLMAPEATRRAAPRMAALLELDRHFIVSGEDGRVEVWDLRFADERSAKRFARFARPVLEDEGFLLETEGRVLRLERPIASIPASPSGSHSGPSH